MKLYDAIPAIGLVNYYLRNSDMVGRALGDGDREINTDLTEDLTCASRRIKFLLIYNLSVLGLGAWNGIETLVNK